jgi:hypothetical protein
MFFYRWTSETNACAPRTRLALAQAPFRQRLRLVRVLADSLPAVDKLTADLTPNESHHGTTTKVTTFLSAT